MCIDNWKQEQIDEYRDLVGRVTPIAAELGGTVIYRSDDEIMERYQRYCTISIPTIPFTVDVCESEKREKRPSWLFSITLETKVTEFDMGRVWASDILRYSAMQEFPTSIKCAQCKTPAAIAKDVTRRLIAGGMILWDRMMSAINERLAMFRAQAENAHRLDMLADQSGIDLRITNSMSGLYRYVVASVKMDGYPAVSVTSDYCRIDMKNVDLTVEQAAAILAIIAPKTAD